MRSPMLKWIAASLLVIISATAIYYFFPEPVLPGDVVIDKLIVCKSRNSMEAYSGDRLIKTYRISIGKNSFGHKVQKGDKRTPEGTYKINDRNPDSGYHKNLGVSYPNAADRAQARKANLDPGGDIKIHGLKNGRGYIGKFHRFSNWTDGCIALTNEEVDELYRAVRPGALIIIKP